MLDLFGDYRFFVLALLPAVLPLSDDLLAGEIVVPAGSVIRVQLDRMVSTAFDYTGARVAVSVVRDVVVGGECVFKEGAPVSADLFCEKPGGWGRGGTIVVRVTSVMAVDSSWVPVSSGILTAGGRSDDSMMLACFLGIWGILFPGQDAWIPGGTQFDCVVARDAIVRLRGS